MTKRTVGPKIQIRNILIGFAPLGILALVLVAAIDRFSSSSDLPNSPIADMAVVHELLPEIAEQVEPKVAEQVEPKVAVGAADVPEKEPEVILPQTPAEIAKSEFERLRALVREIQNDYNLAAAPIVEEQQRLMKESIVLRRSGRLTPKDTLETLKQLSALPPKIEELNKKYDMQVAPAVKEYIKRLEDQNIPEDVSAQCEQDEINKIILANDTSPTYVKGLVERLEQGGDSVMKTRQGRMWVALSVKLTL